MRLFCKIVGWLFAIAYMAALAALAISYWGLFGAEKDPLGGVFLIPLGLPWNLALAGAPSRFQLAIGLFAPLVNCLILLSGCRLLGKANDTRKDRSTL